MFYGKSDSSPVCFTELMTSLSTDKTKLLAEETRLLF